MIVIRSIAATIAVVAGLAAAAPLGAQTSATLNISARVVEECTVKSKRELVKLALERNDPSLIRRCSKGVSNRIDRRVVKVAQLRTRADFPEARRSVGKKRVVRRTVDGRTDVVLITVTY